MNENKVPERINDFIGDSVKALARLFPAAVKDGQVDFEALKEELGQFEEVEKEKYELTWSGKQDAKKKAQENIFGRTLKYVPEDSKNPEATENLYIEGDNLEVLKLLRQNYYGAIKMIYIDPPYNTGNDFLYNDSFKMDIKESDFAEGVRDEYGSKMQKNQKSSNRYHANWLNIIYSPLKIAKDLLTNDGVIFISIDDNEQDNLKKLCNEIFGEENFVNTVIWKKKYGIQNDAKYFSTNHDYILVYAKNLSCYTQNLLPRTEEQDSRYTNRDNDPRGVWKAENMSVGRITEKDRYEIITPGGRKVSPPDGRSWVVSQDTFNSLVDDNRIWFGKDGNNVPAVKKFLSEVKVGRTSSTIWEYDEVGHTDKAKKEVKNLFGGAAYFDYPKPVDLIKQICILATDKDSIVMDFFSGSATTAHSVMKINGEDNGNRKFIMVQLPELLDEKSDAYRDSYRNICDIGKERIRLAGEKIKSEIKEQSGQVIIGEEAKIIPDIGFKVFRTADTNIKWNLIDSEGQMDIEAITHNPDAADFTLGFNDIDVVYEIMLRQKDIPLSEKLDTLSDIGERTYLYGSAYLVCLETEITELLIDKLAALNPLPIKFVFRDSAFKDDINLKDDTFRRLKTLIERNSGTNKSTYTVEFI